MDIEYPLSEAAPRADMDERTFRLLGDRRIVLATPRTRTQGRGKQKLYSTAEILIASILAPLVKLGADTFSLGDLAEWLRANLKGRVFNAARGGSPVYLRLRFHGGNSWTVDMNEAKDRQIAVNEIGHSKGWINDFIAVRLDDKIARVERGPLN